MQVVAILVRGMNGIVVSLDENDEKGIQERGSVQRRVIPLSEAAVIGLSESSGTDPRLDTGR